MPIKRCFVISPIGEPGSPLREHVDDVFDYIIKPAAKKSGHIPMRADHDARPGVITEQMYDSILGDDLLIAVLTFHNPNVFYELAIAEAAARPLILLIERGQPIPFDIKDRRVLVYDMRPRSLIEGVHVKPLVKAINEIEAATSARSVPFRQSLSPLGVAPSVARIERRCEDISPKDRIELIDAAESELDLQGMALFGLWKTTGIAAAITRAIGRKVRVRILLQHPDNPAIGHQLGGFSEHYDEIVRQEILAGWETWSKLCGGARCAEMRMQRTGVMFGMLMRSDQRAIYTPYSLTQPTAESATIVADASSPLHDSLTAGFEEVWTREAPPKPVRLRAK